MDDIDKTIGLESKYMKEIYEKVKEKEENKSNQKMMYLLITLNRQL